MQTLLRETIRSVVLLHILYTIILITSAPKSVSTLRLNENNIVIDDKDISYKDVYQIVHVIEVISKHDDNKIVISYQQENIKSADDVRILEVQSKGFDDGVSLYLITTEFKDSCLRKNASLPSWKIDKGTSNETFHLKINYEQILTEHDFYFCVKNGKLEKHLGISSAFRLTTK